MIDSLSQLMMGLGIALEPTNIAVALLGAVLGPRSASYLV